jgi:hypothetical protein
MRPVTPAAITGVVTRARIFWKGLPMLGSIARRSVVLSSRRSATKTRELRNLRRARRGSSSINARTPTRSVSVSHPTLGGLTERVERVVDTLDSMLKAGPRHLDTRQWQAAQIFRSAYEVLEGAVGNTMDFDRIRGAGLPGSEFRLLFDRARRPPVPGMLDDRDGQRGAKPSVRLERQGGGGARKQEFFARELRHARVNRASNRRAVQPAFRNENPGATQPQKSPTRDVEYQRAHPDAER